MKQDISDMKLSAFKSCNSSSTVILMYEASKHTALLCYLEHAIWCRGLSLAWERCFTKSDAMLNEFTKAVAVRCTRLCIGHLVCEYHMNDLVRRNIMHVFTSFTSCISVAEFLVRMHETSTVCQVGECELLCTRFVGLFGPEHDYWLTYL